MDRRRALLVAALGFALLERWQSVRELVTLHAWLDSWSGLGSIVVGMQRHGYDLTLTHDRNGWRATFLHRSHVLHPWVGQVLHDGPHVWLVSRTGRDHAGRYPEMAEAVRRLSAPTL